MATFPHDPAMSVEEYLALDRSSNETRYEYIDGTVRMMAGGSPDHAKIAANIIGVLYGVLEDSPCSVYTCDVRVYLSESCYVHPDVVVSCDARDQGQEDMIQHPCLIFEVLSPSTEAIDRGRKLAYYRACPSIREYVLVDAQRKSVEIFRREKQKLWTYHALGAGDEVELVSLGVSFALEKMYRKVVFVEGQ